MEEVKFPAVEELPIAVGANAFVGKYINGYKAIINPETEHVYDITSQIYKLVKHEEVIEKAEQAFDSYSAFGGYQKRVRIYKEGARMRATYTFDKKIVVMINGVEDLMNPTVDVFGSYDRSCRHTLILGAFRLICTNGAVIGEKFAYIRKRHMPDLDLSETVESLKDGFSAMKAMQLTWERWSKQTLLGNDYEKTMKVLALNKKETTLLLEEPEASTGWTLDRWQYLRDMPGEKYLKEAEQLTTWIFFNILTQFVTHRIKSEARRIQLEERMRKVLY